MSKKTGLPLGIDVGGSGIKGAPVDLDKGAFAAKRKRIDTPAKSTPEAATAGRQTRVRKVLREIGVPSRVANSRSPGLRCRSAM